MLPAIYSLARLWPAEALSIMIDMVATWPFETVSDRRHCLELFDEALAAFGSQEYDWSTTPQEVATLLPQLAAPSPGDRLYDPAIGSGAMMTAAVKLVADRYAREFTRNAQPPLEVSGVDASQRTYCIAITRLILAGVPNAQLEVGNSLEREHAANPRRDGFDLVLTNPPYGTKVNSEGRGYFPIPTKDGTSLFLQHSISQLRPDGRLLMVVPRSFLFQQASTNVRKWLLDRHRVDAVISLPPGTFLPATSIQASILIVHRDSGPTLSVRMVDGGSYFMPGKGRTPPEISLTQMTALVNAVERGGEGKSTWEVQLPLLAAMGYDLSVTRRENSHLKLALDALRDKVGIAPLKDLGKV
jgi:type I restriction enzyme M protein